MARKRRSSIFLNNQEFFIKEGSYRREIAPTVIPKFSTGDISYSDLTVWQYWAQSDWSGGFDQEQMIDDNKFYFNDGIYVFEPGKLKLTNKWENSKNVGSCSGYPFQFINFDSDFFVQIRGHHTNKVKTDEVRRWSDAASSWVSAQTLGVCNLATGMEVYKNQLRVALADNKFWSMNTSNVWASSVFRLTHPKRYGDFLYGSNISDLMSYNGATAITQVSGESGLTFYKKDILDSNLFIMLSNGENYGEISSFDGNVISKLFSFIGFIGGSLKNFGSRLFFEIRKKGLYSLDFSGFLKELGESDLLKNWSYFITNVGSDEYKDKLVTVSNDGTTKYLLMRDLNGSWAVYSTINASATTPGVQIKNDDFSNILFLGLNGGKTQRLSPSEYDNSGYIESSIIDMDLFNIDKLFGGFTIYHEPLDAGCSITLKIKIDNNSVWTTAGTNSTEGSTSFDIQLLTNNIGKKIQYRIELSTSNSANTPVINDIVIRYILNPRIKKKWYFDLLIADNIEEYNKKKIAKDLDKQLWEILKSGVIKFKDVDGKVYDATKSNTADRGILIENCQQVGPYPFGENGPEFIVSLELTEG